MGARVFLVGFVVDHPPILESLQRCHDASLVVDALAAYRSCADSAAGKLGLDHRRALLDPADGALSTRYDPGDIVALAHLEPAATKSLARATVRLGRALEQNRPISARSLELAITRLPALAPAAKWLVPALMRWLHLRWYEVLYDVNPQDNSNEARQRRAEAEAKAIRPPAGPMRAGERRPSVGREDSQTLFYLVKAWFAVRVGEQSERDVVGLWHKHIASRAHQQTHAAAARRERVLDFCGCRTIVRRGIAEVDKLIAYHS